MEKLCLVFGAIPPFHRLRFHSCPLPSGRGWREAPGEVPDQINSFTTINSFPRSSITLTAI